MSRGLFGVHGARAAGGARRRGCTAPRAAAATRSPTSSTATSTTPTSACTTAASAPSPRDAAPQSLRGPAYTLDLAEIAQRTREAWAAGATEVCLQGGIHPSFTGQTYLDIVAAVKAAAADIHVHAFSPLEISHGAQHPRAVPAALPGASCAHAGLSTLPGTAAEILDDEMRAIICPDKLNTAEWLGVMRAAHAVGLRSTATIMFGHVEQPAALGAPPARRARAAEGDRRLHRVRAAVLRAHGGAAVAQGPGAQRARRCASRC